MRKDEEDTEGKEEMGGTIGRSITGQGGRDRVRNRRPEGSEGRR